MASLVYTSSLMEAVLNSLLLVFASEMGDKTQLLALVLTTRYKKPWTILLGIFIATIFNHALASWLGVWLASHFTATFLRWSLALTFFAFAIWILIPDKDEEFKSQGRFGPLVTTIVVFFLAEMGDKTQLATVALGAKYPSFWLVTIGSTIGMMLSNAMAIFLGDKLLAKIPMKYIRFFACFLFIIFGFSVLLY